MAKIERAEKDLWKTIGEQDIPYTDKQALRNLSDWVIKYFGNVNVSQRLSIMADNILDKI